MSDMAKYMLSFFFFSKAGSTIFEVFFFFNVN